MVIKTANQQRTADALKGLVLQYKSSPLRDAALAVVSQFEAADWQPILFEQACEVVQTPLGFNEDGSLAGSLADEVNGTQAVTVLLATYLALVASENGEKLFTTEEAADYLGVERWTIDHHYRRSGKLKGVKRGGTLFFRKADLDDFQQLERKSGNPHVDKV